MAEAAPLLAKGKRVCKEGCPGCRLDQINKTNTGVPYLNFFYVWVVCLCAALPIPSLFPYLYFMIRDLKVAKQENKTSDSMLVLSPAKKYPNLFSEESIFERFPYFLPCFLISVLAAGVGVACIWLPETLHMYHDDRKEAIGTMGTQVTDLNLENGKAKQSGSGRMASTKSLLKNRQLMSAITLYCVFFLHDTTYLEIFSLWAVSSRKYQGLSLTSQDSGTMLAISGFRVLVYQLVIYPLLVKYAGLIKPFRSAAVLCILLLTTYPFMGNLYGVELKVVINIAALLKNMFAAMITVACNILQHTAVIQEQRGVANGISMTLMSIYKAVAPAAGGILFSWAQKKISGLFLPGDHILFFMLNMVSVIGLSLTVKPFFSMTSVMK